MGFSEPEQTIRLVFEDADYAGAEVVCSGLADMGVFFSLMRLSKSQDPADVESAFMRFGDQVLLSWNVERKGQPIPATAEGMGQISFKFAMLILSSWLNAVQDGPGPLGSASSAGARIPPVSVPMEIL